MDSANVRRDEYLFAQHEKREREAVDRILLDPSGGFSSGLILEPSLGWRGPYSWYAVRIPTARLLPPGMDPRRYPGDVDLMGGPLPYDAPALGQIVADLQAQYPGLHPGHLEQQALRNLGSESVWQWPPRLDVVLAAEVKTVFVDASDELKGIRGGTVDEARAQAEGLSRMGFDRAALLWLVLTEPVNGPANASPWLSAAARAEDGAAKLKRKLDAHGRSDLIGELLLSIGAVPGGLENLRGTVTGRPVHPPPELRRDEDADGALIRASIESVLGEAFQRHDHCPSLPVIVRACSRTRCGALFVAASQSSACPACKAAPG